MRLVRLAVLWMGLVVGPAFAQNVGVVQSEILVLDPDRLFAETMLGQRINADFQSEREKLITRNRAIEAELQAEELALTNVRAEKTPAEFRVLADAFDAKVQSIRQESERRVNDLEGSRERAPITYMQTIEPVLIQLMRETGGTVILDIRSVLLRADVIDITDVAIARVDVAIGDGRPTEPEDKSTGQTTDN